MYKGSRIQGGFISLVAHRQEITTALSGLGFSSILPDQKVISDVIRLGIQDCIGEKVTRALISKLSTRELAEAGLSSNPVLLENILGAYFREGADIILSSIKKRLADHFCIAHDSSLATIIEKIPESILRQIISQADKREHIMLLYKDKDWKNRVLLQFFYPDSHLPYLKLFISSGPPEIHSVNNMTYDELARNLTKENEKENEKREGNGKDHSRKENVLKQFSKMLSEISLSNPHELPVRIAGEDDTWFLEHDLTDEIQLIEAYMSDKPRENVVVLSTYSLQKLLSVERKVMENIVSAHGIVILDDPIDVYRKEGQTEVARN